MRVEGGIRGEEVRSLGGRAPGAGAGQVARVPPWKSSPIPTPPPPCGPSTPPLIAGAGLQAPVPSRYPTRSGVTAPNSRPRTPITTTRNLSLRPSHAPLYICCF